MNRHAYLTVVCDERNKILTAAVFSDPPWLMTREHNTGRRFYLLYETAACDFATARRSLLMFIGSPYVEKDYGWVIPHLDTHDRLTVEQFKNDGYYDSKEEDDEEEDTDTNDG